MESSFRRRWGVSVAPSSRSREPKSHTEERNFPPPALSKVGCWGFMTQAMIHALVSFHFRSSVLLLDEVRERSQQPTSEQRRTGGRKRNCSPAVQWTAGRQPRVFSTHIYLAHSSDPSGSSRGREQTFVLSFVRMGEHLERFVCFSDLNTLSHSKGNNQTSELQKGSGGTSGKVTRHSSSTASQPAHGTQNIPGISTQPIESGLSFCLLFSATWYTLFSLCYKSLALGHQSKHLHSVLVQSWTRWWRELHWALTPQHLTPPAL